MPSSQEILIAVGAMPATEPMGWPLRPREAERRAVTASSVLARVVLNPLAFARSHHAFGEFERFVTHSGLIGPTNAGWSLGCLLISVALTSRPTRLN